MFARKSLQSKSVVLYGIYNMHFTFKFLKCAGTPLECPFQHLPFTEDITNVLNK